jgi:hypothetical protein
VNDEARSFLARDTGRYDVLQISLIDTWAATAAGAFVLSESAVYTREAWRTFLARLTDTGVLSVSRWYGAERPGEVYRMIALARVALADAGVRDARRHILLVRNIRATRDREQPESVGTLLVSRTPFTDEDRARLRQVSSDLAFEVMFDGGAATDPELTTLIETPDLDAFARAYPINIEPPTDDSPFFFQMLRLRDLADVALMRGGKNQHNMQAVFVLGVLTATVVALGIACVLVPGAVARPRVPLRPVRWHLAYFAAIGLGFMLIEIALMQRLILLLGHPTYGLSVVLFSLLLGGGAGSWLTRHVTVESAPAEARRRLLALVLALAAIGLMTPVAITSLESEATAVRAVSAGVVLFLAGLLMGQAFPLGMRLAAHYERHTLWLWGVNGAMSVCASVLAIVIALSWSISAAFWTGAAAYALALLAAWKIPTGLAKDVRA